MRNQFFRSVLVFLAFLISACSPKISGTVRLLDATMKPVVDESVQGTVVNMINTTAPLEEASHSAVVNEKGVYQSEKKALKSGKYMVEAKKLGYETETVNIDLGTFSSKKINFDLKKIPEGSRKSIRGAETDSDKIINPGEVNIQPPSM